MEEIDRPVGSGAGDGVVDAFVDRYRAHRQVSVRERLGHGHDVGPNAEALRGEGPAGTAEPGDDLVEHEQDAVTVTDFTQPLEVAERSDERPGRTRNRLHEAGGDRLRSVEAHEALEIVGEFCSFRRLAPAEAVFGKPGVAHVGDVRHAGAEGFAVLDHAAQAGAAHVDTVVCAFPGHHARSRALAPGAMIGERDLYRGIDRLRARVSEEDAVDAVGGEGGHAPREFELRRMAELKGRAVVEFQELAVDRIGDFRPAVARRYAEEAGRAVEDLFALVVAEEDASPVRAQARGRLELAVGGEGHPQVFEAVCGELHLVVGLPSLPCPQV